MRAYAEPQSTGSTEVQAVVPMIDSKGCSETAGAASKIENASGLAMALHEFDAFERFERANEYRRGGSGSFTHHIEHEMSSVVEENVGVAGSKIHGANARRGAAEVMTGRITGRIGFCFDDAAAEASGRELANHNFPDEEAGQGNCVDRKFRPP
jgi:hypothetical protein